MNIVLLCHPQFSVSQQSMPRFAAMLEAGLTARGHRVTRWSPRAYFSRAFRKPALKKWAGYIDQYLIFPRVVRRRLTRCDGDTLFVFCDQALGPWVPLVCDRPHVVHAHDLLALRSALGLIKENPTGATGRVYQKYIRRGFRLGKNFVSISKKTREDLHRYGEVQPVLSEVVYNGLNFPYAPLPRDVARRQLEEAGLEPPQAGMLLHLGGNQWYKNLHGLIEWYAVYAAREREPLPLWCISPKPAGGKAFDALGKVPAQGQVNFYRGLDNRTLQAAYSYASAFLFPSLAEGFGWPIIEAQACGCPVITTGEAPMTEVGGDAALYLPRLQDAADVPAWAALAADELQRLLALDPAARALLKERGLASAQRFDAGAAIDGYVAVYRQVLDRMSPANARALRNGNSLAA